MKLWQGSHTTLNLNFMPTFFGRVSRNKKKINIGSLIHRMIVGIKLL